jgi:predicted transglutaminase-like cysteine proteinase
MGKAQIITDYGSGQYKIKMLYGGRTKFNQRLTILTNAIAALQTRIDNETDDYKKRLLKLEKAALEKSKSYLQNRFPPDYEITVFCCDNVEGLGGNVGTIDIPGEATEVKIQPGYFGAAGYNSTRDGLIWPSVAGSADWCYFNQAILPGWQKAKPTYRIGTIITGTIDNANDTCDVCIEPAFSTAQYLGVNQSAKIEGCPFVGHQGFEDFCTRNPGHPTCTNTDAAKPMSVGSTLYNKIKEINLDVNTSHNYATDKSGWRANDYWDIMSAGETGDCEDFALTKMQELIDYGVPVKNLQIATCYVERGLGYHAVLMIQTQNRGTLILDNRFDAVMDKGSLEALGYNFHTYQEAGHDWANFSTKLLNVPIEYMSCNANAFDDEDQVIVKFENQSWNNPKVIGFRNDPAACDPSLWWVLTGGNYYYGPSWGLVGEYDISSDVGYNRVMTNPQYGCGAPLSSAVISQSIYVCGGAWQLLEDFPWTNKPFEKRHRKFKIVKGWGVLNYGLQDMLDPARAYGPEGLALNEKFYALGGTDRDVYYEDQDGTEHHDPYPHDAVRTVERYDPLIDSWDSRQDTSVGRMRAGTFAINNFGYFVGGHEKHDEICHYYPEIGWTLCSFTYKNTTDRNDFYDPSGDAWAGRKDMITTRFGCSSSEYDGKGVVALGGHETFAEVCGDFQYRRNAELYDPATDSWSSTPDCPGWDHLPDQPPCLQEIWENTAGCSMIANRPCGSAFNNFYVATDYDRILKYNAATNIFSIQKNLNEEVDSIGRTGGVVW